MSDPATADQSCPSCKGTGNSGYVRNIINADGTRTWEYLPCFCTRLPFVPAPPTADRLAELEAENAQLVADVNAMVAVVERQQTVVEAERALADQLAAAVKCELTANELPLTFTAREAIAAWEARRG